MNQGVQLTGILQNYCGWVNKNMRILPGLLLCLTLWVADARAMLEPPELSANSDLYSLLALSRQQALASSLDWLNLLHYKASLLGSPASQADDQAFFLSESGATDAAVELEVMLKLLWGDDLDRAQQVLCRFPARAYWLSRQLQAALPVSEQSCSHFMQWKRPFESSGLTLLFPSMYLNNPASMFGHTFLRFDNTQSELLRQTLSYAAHHDDTDAFISYAWKGITGGYSGRFFVQPYYETLLKYSDIEQRDIWEYTLNLSEDEVAQLLRHLWEVKGIHFEYFFLRENCSYRLLALLDVARPGLALSYDSHPVFAAPVDIVRDVINAGLVETTHYRPAMGTRLRQMAAQLGDALTAKALAISEGDNIDEQIDQTVDVIQKARVLRLADELLSYQSETPANIQHTVLSELSSLGLSAEQTAFVYNARPPENSHATSRWQLTAGEIDGQDYYQIGFRPVFHDLLDDPAGLLNGASVNVLDTRFRWFEEEQKLELSQLRLFELKSLLRVTRWEASLSKQLLIEFTRRDELAGSPRVFKFEAGLGYAYGNDSGLIYALANLRLDYSAKLIDDYAAYTAAEIGLLWQPDAYDLQFELNARHYSSFSGQEEDIEEYNLGLQYQLGQQHALRIEAKQIEYLSNETKTSSLSYLFYF